MANFYLGKESICKVLENLTLRRTSHISVLDVQRRDKLIPNPQISQWEVKCVYGYPKPEEGERKQEAEPRWLFRQAAAFRLSDDL